MTIGTSSVYTTGNFDGMALVVDSYGGKVRSFEERTRRRANIVRVEVFADS